FSVTDKIPFLKEAGFRRFIIELSGPPLKKTNYKDLMRAVDNGTPLPRISRFNWKNGFFHAEETSQKNRNQKTADCLRGVHTQEPALAGEL
ncbi:MAG: hypothetical protein LBH20_08255, partial [Treponema sp.]|nr:hypothetical protein [Treponema sp.]